MSPLPEKFNEERKQVQGAVRERMMASITGALGLIVGLAWNDAVKSAIESVFPVGSGISAKFIYAIVLTLVIAIAIYYISKFFEKKAE